MRGGRDRRAGVIGSGGRLKSCERAVEEGRVRDEAAVLVQWMVFGKDTKSDDSDTVNATATINAAAACSMPDMDNGYEQVWRQR